MTQSANGGGTQNAPAEKTYTKADVMAALAAVETPLDDEMYAEIKDFPLVRCVELGANLLADALFEGLDPFEVGKLRVYMASKAALEDFLRHVQKGSGRR